MLKLYYWYIVSTINIIVEVEEVVSSWILVWHFELLIGKENQISNTSNEQTHWPVCEWERISLKSPQSNTDIWALKHWIISPPCFAHPAASSCLHPSGEPRAPAPEGKRETHLERRLTENVAAEGLVTVSCWRSVGRTSIFPLVTSTVGTGGWTGQDRAALGVSVWSHREDFIGATDGKYR